MPSTYAHYRFGQQVYRRLPEKIRSEIQPYKSLFDIDCMALIFCFIITPCFLIK